MWLPRIFAMICALSAIWFVWCFAAQDPRPAGPIQGQAAQLHWYPDRDYPVWVDLRLGEGRSRRFHVHRENPLSGRVGKYYHRPLFALMTSPKPVRGYPAYVHAVDATTNPGTIKLNFRILLSQPRYRALCERSVYELDLDYVTGGLTALTDRAERERPPADVIEVFQWPTEEVEVQCVQKGTSEVLATAHVDGLPSETDWFECGMPFTPGALQRFEELEGLNLIAFRFYYLYTGVQVGRAVRDMTGMKVIHSVIEDELTSEQRKGEVPLFQVDRDRVERAISTHINTVSRIEHPELLPVLSSMAPILMARFFDPVNDISLGELSSQYPQAKSYFAAYLAPQLESLTKVEGVDKITVDTSEKENISLEELGIGGSAGAAFPILGAVAKVNIFGSFGTQDAERELKRWESASGMKTEVVEQGTSLKAHNIRTYSLAEGWDKVEFDQTDTVFLAMQGEQAGYRVDGEVSPELNDVWLAKAVEDALLSPSAEGWIGGRPVFEGIQLGMMIPYFGSGDNPPRGFVWADGKTRWPNASWVPEHMRDGVGKDDFVPNMDEYLLGGSQDIAEIGTVYQDGVV